MNPHFVVMARAPEPGGTKTRLAQAIGDEAAAALAQRMLERVLETARSVVETGSLELSVADNVAHPGLIAAARNFDAILSEQGEGDLGQRMARIAQRVLADGELPIIVGSDCPSLAPHHLRMAVQSLQIHDAMFQPASDGGYVMIGLRRFHPSLFEAIPWGTPSVMALTRARLRDLEWSWCEGEPLHDIDSAADLAYLPVDWLRPLTRSRPE